MCDPSHCICQMTFCLFAIGPSASVSNSADRPMLLNQLLTERSDQRRSPQKSAFKTNATVFCAGHCTWKRLVSIPTRPISHSRQEHLQTTACRSAQIGTSLPISFCSGVDAGNALAKDLPSDTLRSGWAAALRRAVSLHPLCWLPWRCGTFSPSLFSEWAPLSGKHLSK